MKDKLRTVYLRPFLDGPRFTLTTYATPKCDWRGQTRIGYVLIRRDGKKREILFSGEDFCGSPLHADDSDATMATLLNFLTLRPGDTDPDWFSSFSTRQLEWAQSFECEALGMEASHRFGEC